MTPATQTASKPEPDATSDGARPSRRKSSEPTGTRERILARAVQIASAEGLEALTIGRLASELGMSKSGLFGHFGSKEGLQIATVEAGSEIYTRVVIDPAMRKPAGKERLRELAFALIRYLEDSVFEGGCFWGSVSAEFDNREGPVRDKIVERMSAWMKLLAEQAKEAGHADPRQTAFELQAIGQGANMQYQLYRDPTVYDRARKAMEKILEQG